MTARGRYDRATLWVLVLATFATRVLFLYRAGAPDPDAVAMMAGMALGASGDVSVGDAVLYGRNVNPGMHVLAVHVFPALLDSPRHILPFLNWLTVACASLVLLPFYSLIRPYLPHGAAIACVAIWALTPIVWESGTYYHPLAPAVFCLMLALVYGRRIAHTTRGALFSVLAALLASLAFLLRVEVVFVWPALLVATLTSQRRVRDTAVLVAISLVAVIAYLLVARAMLSSTSAETLATGGFLKMVSGLYAHSFNLRGLPRSIAWMAMGLGLASLAACLIGLARRRGIPGVGRVVVIALAWALPSILFWLPQPTPILRHYLLASMGITVVLGATVLTHLTPRRLVMVAVSVVILNLALPEVFYRVYNARLSQLKTPHGSFFYFHAVANQQVAHNVRIAERITTCGDGTGVQRSCALVRWETLAHVAYALSVSGRELRPEPVVTVFPGVRDVRFRVDDGEVRLVHYVYFEDQALRERVAQIMSESQVRGYCLFAPRELCERVPELQSFVGGIEGF